MAVGVAFGPARRVAAGVAAARSDDAAHGAVLLMAPVPLYLSAETAGGSGIWAVVLAADGLAGDRRSRHEGRLQ